MNKNKLIGLIFRREVTVARSMVYIIFLVAVGCFNTMAIIAMANGGDRGYLTSIEDLENIRRMAEWGGDHGVEPSASLVNECLQQAGTPEQWDHGDTGGEFETQGSHCVSTSVPDGEHFIDQQGGAQGVYQKM